MDHLSLQLRVEPSGSGAACRRVMVALPGWFGIERSVDEYARVADRTPTVLASVGDRDVGFLTVVRHTSRVAEIHVMGVLPEFHRRGVGRRMLGHAERALVADGVELLQVKTLSATKADEGYARTRAFYLASGFRPVEELPDLWGPENPALLMAKSLAAPGRGSG